MIIIRTIAVAFAQYSRIPVPHFEWKDEDMRCNMSAFPLIGVVIGILFYTVSLLCSRSAVPQTAEALLLAAVPVMLTGGFHIDGFMDTSDALSSYRSREEKLEILKDPHIGAFAVIRLVLAGLVYLAALVIILESERATDLIRISAAGFVLARGLSALGVLCLRPAKENGMLRSESEAAQKSRKVNLSFSMIWIMISLAYMIMTDITGGCIAGAAGLFSFAWYRYKSYKEIGGITGDTAGWFVVVCEIAVTAAAALVAITVSLARQ